MPDWLTPVAGGVVLALYVQPRASRNEIVGEIDGALKVRLTSPPVEGAANKLCCAFIAKACGVPKRDVTIVSGETSRHKSLVVAGLDVGRAETALKHYIRK